MQLYTVVFFVLYYSYLFALLFDPISLPIVKRKWCLIISFPSTQLLSDDDDESVEVDLEGLFSDMHIMYTGHYHCMVYTRSTVCECM